MALEPQKAYLHLVTGGFDNTKRREVRKLFVAPSESQEDGMTSTNNLDLAVGLLEEFYSIGVKEFDLKQAKKTLEIFRIKIPEPSENEAPVTAQVALRDLLNSPRLRLYNHDDVWVVPDEKHIENLRTQFCDCGTEALIKRRKELQGQRELWGK